MDFNTTLADKSSATDKLEKPFDAQSLKEVTKKYVSKLTPHPLDGFLVTPRLPDFTESETFIRQKSEIEKQFILNLVQNSCIQDGSICFTVQNTDDMIIMI